MSGYLRPLRQPRVAAASSGCSSFPKSWSRTRSATLSAGSAPTSTCGHRAGRSWSRRRCTGVAAAIAGSRALAQLHFLVGSTTSWRTFLGRSRTRSHLFRPDAERLHRYGEAALEQGSLNLATAAKGERNATLFREAVSLAELVGAEVLPEERVWREVTCAARSAGLRSFEIRVTLASAFRRGLGRPRLPK